MRYGNYSVRCPHCYRLLEHLSDYGFGPVTPFYICVGSEVVGIVEEENHISYLNFNGQRIRLKETYFNAVHEAEKYIVEKKKMTIKQVEPNIVTTGGSLCLFGEFFGRPHDNFHRIKSVDYDGQLLVIVFDHWEELFVYNPSNIKSDENELRIEKADKVKWSYTPYGSITQVKTETYLYDNSKVTKNTDKDEKIILSGKVQPAVQLER